MANVIKVIQDGSGNNVFPLTHEKAVRDSSGVSLETKLASLESKTYITAWDGESTPVVANIPAGVVVTYNNTNYTGTLAASASTDGKIYLVKNGTEYDRYFSTLDLSSNRVWSNLGTTAVTLEVVDDLTTGGSTKALSAEQGKVLNENLGQLDQEVYGFKGNYTVSSGWKYNAIPGTLLAGEKYTFEVEFAAAPNATVYLAIVDTASQDASAIVSLNVASGLSKNKKEYTPASNLSGLYFRTYAGSAQGTVTLSIIGRNSSTSIRAELDAVENEVLTEINGISIGKESNAYVKFSDGTVVSSSGMRCYEVPNDFYEKVSVFTGYSDSGSAAIAFYNNDGYMSSASVQSRSGGYIYEAAVPAGCTLIRVTNRPATLASPTFTLWKSLAIEVDTYGYDLIYGGTRPSGWAYTKLPITLRKGVKYYIEAKVKDALTSTGLYLYITPATGAQDANALGSLTIPVGGTVGRWVFTPTQDYATLYLSSYRGSATNNFVAKIYTMTSVERIAEDLSAQDIRRLYNPYRFKPFMHHLNVEGDTTVPSQSLPDIYYAKKLGFDWIEANAHKCSDNVFVCKHGNNGALGSGLVFAEGSELTSATLFSEVSSTTLREEVTYSSPLVQNQTFIPTLDEFCAECKRVGIGLFLDCHDSAVLAVARQYLPDDMIIAYGLTERGDFKGLVTAYTNASNGAGMLGTARRIGAPFLFGWQNYGSFSESVVKQAVADMHAEGYMVGAAYLTPNGARTALERGIDSISSTYKEINPFADMPIHIGDERLILSSGASIEDGIIDLPQGQTIKIEESNNGAVAVCVSARYDGTLSIVVGGSSKNNQKGLIEIESDNSSYVEYAGTAERSSGLLYIVADANTTVYELSVGTRRII